MTTTIYVRDRNLDRLVEVSDYTELELRLRHNEPSSWRLTVPAGGDGADALAFGTGIIVVRDGRTLLSGPLRGYTRKWSATEDNLVALGADDSVWLENRLALPDPAGPPYSTQAHDTRLGAAETVMRAYVDVNAGPSARTERRVKGLVLDLDYARGADVIGRARFANLGGLLRSLASAGGGLGFRIAQTGSELRFEIYEPTDRSDSAIFSPDRGNLSSFELTATAPEANYIYTGGAGEGTGRLIAETGDSQSIVDYGRAEIFTDRRDTADTDELAQHNAEHLASKAEEFGLTLEPVDTPALAFGVDYDLGDTVSVIVDDEPLEEAVRFVKLTLGPGGETIEPAVTTPGRGDPDAPRFFERIVRVDERLSNLERR